MRLYRSSCARMAHNTTMTKTMTKIMAASWTAISTKISTLVVLTLLTTICSHANPSKPALSSISLKKQLDAQPNNLALRERLASQYFNERKYTAVVETLAAYSNEITIPSLVRLAEAYGRAGDTLNEIRALQFYVEREPQRFRPYYLLGLAFKSTRRYDEAILNLRKSTELARKHRPSYDELLDIFVETKQNYEGRTLLTSMIDLFGPKSEFYNLLCKLYATDGFLAEAVSFCKKAISKNNRFPDNHIYLANTFYNQGNKTGAARIFTTAANQFRNSEFVQYAAGEFYLNEKNPATAVRYLKNAVALNNRSFRAQLTLALALFDANEYEKALNHFSKSCELDQSKETLTLIRNSAARLRQPGTKDISEQYDKRAATCQTLR